MYKYFSELEKPNDYNVYLKKRSFDRKRDKYISNVCLSDNFLIDYKELFKRIAKIDMLVEGSNEKILLTLMREKNLSYEEWQCIGDFLLKKDEDYFYTKAEMKKIDINANSLKEILTDYLVYCKLFVIMYPAIKEFLLETEKVIEKALEEINVKTKIEIEALKDNNVVYTFPNAWYITPNGFLYNTGTGHNEGNLRNPFYNMVGETLKKEQIVSDVDLNFKIKEILKRGYVTASEFENYSNLIYEIPTILTPEVEYALERYKSILKLNEEEFKRILKKDGCPHIERTYQKKIINLVVGYLAAKTILLQSFKRINDSARKKEIIDSFYKMNFDDILVRYCGFHKVSSIRDKTITTSSLRSIELFKEYLNRGWTLDIIPGIVYDKLKDELIEVDFNWYYIEKYLDNTLNKFDSPGKILIKK